LKLIEVRQIKGTIRSKWRE